jgi:hypothetical protein
LKTLIAGKVESMLVGKVPDSVPVELIFERIHGQDFAAINLALAARETQNFKRRTESATPTITEDGIAAKLLPLLAAKIGDKMAASDNALIAKLGDKFTPETPDDGSGPVNTGLISGGACLWAAERLWSAWTRRRRKKQAEELEANGATA